MIARRFDASQDIPLLQAFLDEMRQQVSQAAYYQFGDLLWRIHILSNHFDPEADLRIWQQADGQVAGFVHYLAVENNPEFFLRPEHYDGDLAGDMVDWAVARAKLDRASDIETSCVEDDVRKATFLARAGFQETDDAMVFMARSLANNLPDLHLPAGYTFASAAKRPDLPGVTGDPITPEAYAALIGAPGYRDELGVRVVHGDEIVAGCIAWYDAIDRCGEFEPVGTAEVFRGRGLAFAAMAQAMENLRQAGAEMVYVRTGEDNLPAVRLYEKLGFVITDRDLGWTLTMTNAEEPDDQSA